MNGHITWKQMTYADKLGITRSSVHKAFQKLEELSIIIPHKDNKPGGKQNKYDVNFSNIKLLEKPPKKKKKKETCITSETDLYHRCTEPVSPEKQTCITDNTYNKHNKDNKSLLEEEASFDDAPSSKDPEALEDFLKELDMEK